MQHDVRVLCLRTEAERDARFASDKNYFDPERDQRWVAWRESDRARYLQNAEQHFSNIASDCRQANIPYWRARIQRGTACLRSFCVRQVCDDGLIHLVVARAPPRYCPCGGIDSANVSVGFSTGDCQIFRASRTADGAGLALA